MEAIYVSIVGDTEWTTVSLGAHYNSAIPVCTVQYPWEEGRKVVPAIVRVQNIRARSFEIRLQNPSGEDLPERPVHCIVVEQGSWTMPDGRVVEANQYISTTTDHSGSFEGEAQMLKNSFQNPIVIGQVLSYNDPRWSVFWSRGSDVKSGISADAIYTGKHVGTDNRTSRINESVGYIVFESGHTAYSGIEIEAARGGSVKNYVNGTHPYIFEKSFVTAPMVAVLSSAGMEDVNGCWAVLCSNPTTSLMFVATDEDRNGESARSHFSKGKIDYVAFSITGTLTLQSTRSMTKHQWYLPNVFSQDPGHGRRDLTGVKSSMEISTIDSNERHTPYLRRPFTVDDGTGHLIVVYYAIGSTMLIIVLLSLLWLVTREASTAQLPHYTLTKETNK